MSRPEDFSKDEFEKQLQLIFAHLTATSHVVPCASPKAILLGGQSGAGKTRLHEIYRKALSSDALVINGDEYRSRHPRYQKIDAAYGIDAPAYTAAWASRMTEALIDAASKCTYNLIVEGTLRTAETPIKTATFLKERGYVVSLAVMAVKPEISLVSCQLRYEQMRIAGTTPRAVDPAHHRAIVEAIVDNLAALEESGLFDDMSLYSRSGERLFSSKECAAGEGASSGASEGGPAGASAASGPFTCAQTSSDAAATLREILFGAWTGEEQAHYEYLLARLEEARSLEAGTAV